MIDSTLSRPRHALVVRVSHWVTTVAFVALLVTGVEILISHPRFYWGEVGNVETPSLFDLPIPASRGSVKTSYDYVLPDQNGWSRSLHFQSAWVAVLTGLVYVLWGWFAGHFRRNLLPAREDYTVGAVLRSVGSHLRLEADAGGSYNLLQRVSYLKVIFVLFPAMIWTGLAMSPGFTSVFPFTVTVLGGHQSARTIHFFVTVLLVLFVVGHVVMVWRAGLRKRVGAMITGGEEELR